MATKKSRTKRAPVKVYSIRLRPEVIQRAEDMVDVLNESATFVAATASGRLDRSMVLRLAIERGLAQLEAEHADKKAPVTAKPCRRRRLLPDEEK